jgi:NADH-quinone oxidoreductase subunit M
MPLLSILIWSPLALAALLAALPRSRPGLLRGVALLATLISLGQAVLVACAFEGGRHGLQLAEAADWVPSWGIRYCLGVDGVSLLLILLNAFLFPAAVLASWKSVQDNLKEFLILLLGLESAVYGVFLAQDVFLFYLFWEASLIPMYFLVGVWGGERRVYATLKFVLYTLSGSLIMLAAILWMAFKAGRGQGTDFSLAAWQGLALAPQEQAWLYGAFFIAFAIKVPLFPFHTWLPDAHVEAPTAGSVLLAGVLLKMGTYGLWRFNQSLFPAAALQYRPLLVALALIGLIYGAFMVLVQTDFKKMVAYSSVSHMGACVLGLASYDLQGQSGAVLTMVNHGISTGALFLVVGMFYERTHTRDLSKYGGAAARMPLMALLFTPVALSSMGVPGTNGFANEFLVMVGAWRISPWVALVAATSLVLAAAYMLRMLQKTLLGPLGEAMGHLQDLDLREAALLAAFVALILAIGIWPQPLLDVMAPALKDSLAHIPLS